MLGARLGGVLRGPRAALAVVHAGAAAGGGWRKVGLAAGVGGIGGAVLGCGGCPAHAEEAANWRFTAPAAESRERSRAMSSQEGFKEPPIVVTISGAAGQIAYSLLPLVCSGQVFGPDRPVSLRLLDIEPSMQALRGVVMELEDAAYPLLENVYVTSSYEEAFQDSEAVILLGGFPRRPGMERVDLIHKNTSIFRSMGPAINKYARKDVKVVVVANPANTNCLTLIQHCPSIPKENFSALMRLDHNRASALTARSINRKLRKASSKGGRAEGVIEDSSRISASDVSNVIIWGNHSATQYPDLSHAVVTLRSHRPAPAYSILAKEFIEGDFVAQIQTRGAKVIQARKLSSALSAAHATAAHMRDWFFGTAEGTIVSMAVYSDGTHYDVPEGVVFGFPCVCKPNGGGWEIIDDMYIDQFSKEMLDKNINELNDEKAMAASAS